MTAMHELFPFAGRFAEIDGARIHYVDEGSGPPVLLLHGNPTWSFVYRDVIGGLRDRFRCIAVDHPGFGRSTAAPGYGFTPAEHAAVLERRDRPALIVWPTKDVAFRERERRRWEATFPDHRTALLEGAGHYMQEDAPEEIVAAIRAWAVR